jgi:Ca2+-binding EF-hand superfamily protein
VLGAKGLIGLQRQFRIIDDDGSQSLNMAEFKKAMKEVNVKLKNPRDAEQLFCLFDRDRSGTISFEEFLSTIRVRK